MERKIQFILANQLGTSELTTHAGTSGGPALSGFDTHFKQKILITNNGKVYGGAGGGGGGLPGISAAEMPVYSWPLWFGCGGGGGGGLHSKNVGKGGSAAVDSMSSQNTAAMTKAHLQDGEPATPSWTGAGGAGGALDAGSKYYGRIELQKNDSNDSAVNGISATVTDYPAMTGNPGGNIGEPGKSDGTVANYYTLVGWNTPKNGDDGSWANILSNYKLRAGGAAGNIITSTVTPVTASTNGLGSFHGTGNYNPDT